jgi:hypothetical protein
MGRPKTRTPEIIREQAKKRTRKYRLKNRDNPEYWERARAVDKKSYANNPEGKKQRSRDYRAAHPEQYMFTEAKRRSNKRGWYFDLEQSDIMIPEVCPVLGIPIFRGYAEGTKAPGPNSPSLDRIDSAKGYVKGNVEVISWRANRIKYDATIQELEAVVAYMKTKLGGN